MADWWIHVAYATTLLSFSVRDILWLRVFSALAAVFVLGPSLLALEPVSAVTGWNALIIALNGLHIVWLILERRPLRLSIEEEVVHELFPNLTQRQVRRFTKGADWRSATGGDLLVRRGTRARELLVVLGGQVLVDGQGAAVELGSGSFIGEMTFLSDAPASVDAIVVSRSLRYVSWPLADLERWSSSDPQLHHAVQHAVAQNLVQKLRAA